MGKKIIKFETAKRKHKEIHQDIDIAKDLLKRIPISRNDNRNWKAELPKILKSLHSKEKIYQGEETASKMGKNIWQQCI